MTTTCDVVPTLEELTLFSSEVFLCEPCLRNTPAVFCRHFWTLPKPGLRDAQRWRTIEEAHRQVATLWLKRRLDLPLHITVYDEVITYHYLRADNSPTESRVAEFLSHGWISGDTARFGWEILWEYSTIPIEELEQLHELLMNTWADTRTDIEDQCMTFPLELQVTDLAQQEVVVKDISKRKELGDRPQDERTSKRSIL
ncbi:hypothetical protein FRC19_006792 [Serendipita sp. 401]|nr:hypothetical protein FRC19_006792 [Serendipita sp. 401]KAG9057571.1 hypothetical protein FS842_005532 [Serendipita sp. 407]